MKNLIFTCILITTAVITANAQFFVEGSVGLSYSNTENLNDVSSSSFNISPRVGYWLNDNFAVGINPIVSGKKNNNIYNNEISIDMEYKTRDWYFSVFGRYKLWGTEKLSLLVETPVGYGISTLKYTSGEITVIEESISRISVSVLPLASYKLSERFNIVTRCNFFSFDFSSFNTKDKKRGGITTINNFNFNAKSSLFDSLGNISIGFMYNF